MVVSKMKKQKEIINILSRHKDELKQKYNIKEIGIFGSYIRDEQNKTSDIDILVEFSPEAKISLLDFIHIENYLNDLLGVKVDLVEKSALKPRIGKQILKEVSYL
jgi:hypothetical protein